MCQKAWSLEVATGETAIAVVQAKGWGSPDSTSQGCWDGRSAWGPGDVLWVGAGRSRGQVPGVCPWGWAESVASVSRGHGEAVLAGVLSSAMA